jgi:CTP synthase
MIVNYIRPQFGALDIAVVGKYVSLRDAYKSIYEALDHAGIANSIRVNIHHIEAEDGEKNVTNASLKTIHGILVPGGFGHRGIEGKIKVIRYARENKIPYFGICLGMQCAVIEFARHCCGLKSANSYEFDESTSSPVIELMAAQKIVRKKGGTMRLGSYPCNLLPDSKAAKAYGANSINERHRHRYELNNKFKNQLSEHGMLFSGVSPNNKLIEIIELADHPWFLGCQFHPEFQSTPLKAHPLFTGFIAASRDYRNQSSS